MYKRFCAALLLCVLTLSFVSCSSQPKYSHAELVINLPDEFEEVESADFDKTYSNGQAAAALLRISFVAALNEGIPDTFGADEFALFWLMKNERQAEMQVVGGVDFCEYYESVLGIDYYYLAAFYRSHHAYFVVLFTTPKAMEDEYRVKFIEYATNIYFKDGN